MLVFSSIYFRYTCVNFIKVYLSYIYTESIYVAYLSDMQDRHSICVITCYSRTKFDTCGTWINIIANPSLNIISAVRHGNVEEMTLDLF